MKTGRPRTKAEAYLKQVMYIRVPTVLKRRVVAEAKRRDVPINTLMIEFFERELERQSK